MAFIKQLEENDIPGIIKSSTFNPGPLEEDLEMVLSLAEKHDQVVWIRHSPGYIQWWRVDKDEAETPVFRQQIKNEVMWANRKGRTF